MLTPKVQMMLEWCNALFQIIHEPTIEKQEGGDPRQMWSIQLYYRILNQNNSLSFGPKEFVI